MLCAAFIDSMDSCFGCDKVLARDDCAIPKGRPVPFAKVKL